MRIVTKGGVWKNTEDEILKAAVMKYGKNQWARISSLLVRKSAKQCKARWYEWLDPSIKKTEWSREEEEKLLHLAKIMPNQWKTIAPLVGRTASQCIEHYEKLLDAAQNEGENFEAADDPRRLRPGEIDPNPEAKPAKPDPVDMDEDEKEMLSEARARLANTKGKKAKRKMREKQLEEARRLAALQKRRELKAAGIDTSKPKKRVKGVDYNAEIPFFKKPAPGFYEVDFEQNNRDNDMGAPFKPVSLEDVDPTVKRKREIEENKKEATKKQKAKEKKNLPDAIMQINKLNEAEQTQTRGKMILPAPQLDERTVEEIAKLDSQGMASRLLENDDVTDGSGDVTTQKKAITRGLLQNYAAGGATPAPFGQTPGMMTPARGGLNIPANLRTPLAARTPSREDHIMREAQNLVALTSARTPLYGGENPLLKGSDFSGATPKRVSVQTPNVLATPARNMSRIIGATPGATPVRDMMGINSANFQGNLEKAQQSALKRQLQQGLKALPTPQNEYNIVLPDMPEDAFQERDDADGQTQEEDASDELARYEKAENEKRALLLRLQSQVLKRHNELPRPYILNGIYERENNQNFTAASSSKSGSLLSLADELIRAEMVQLISYEAATFPEMHSKVRPYVSGYEQFSEHQLSQAQQMISAETEILKKSPKHSVEAVQKILSDENHQMIYVPSKKTFVEASSLSKAERIEAMSKQFEDVRGVMVQEAARSKKLESKLNVIHGGYQKRSSALIESIQQLNDEITQTSFELYAFTQLHELETVSMPLRVEKLANEVKQLEDRESQLQLKYRNLITERQNLLASA